MTLWHLRPAKPDDPILRQWDVAVGFVVCARTELEARVLAAQKAGDEGASYWLEAAQTDCMRLEPDGPPRIVLRDFRNG